jgi:hypothetical protein
MNWKHMLLTGIQKVSEFKPLIKAESLIIRGINKLSEAPKVEPKEAAEKVVEVV